MEEELGGGGLTPVVRIGDTVRRATGAWTPAVHALLRHLESVGFDGAPRVRGIDEHGREVLEFVTGNALDDLDDDALAAVARLIRAYHDATETFEPPREAQWQRMVGAPAGDVICHNDLSPSNTICVGGEPRVFVDWDLAAPATRLWDLAYAAWRFVPLYSDADCARLELPLRPRGRRLRLLCDAYGLEQRDELLPTIRRRQLSLYETAREWGTAGRPGWADVWRDTRGEQWLRSVAFLDDHAPELSAAITA